MINEEVDTKVLFKVMRSYGEIEKQLEEIFAKLEFSEEEKLMFISVYAESKMEKAKK